MTYYLWVLLFCFLLILPVQNAFPASRSGGHSGGAGGGVGAFINRAVDKAIDRTSNFVTPEADKTTREIQREAIKSLDPRKEKSQQHLDNMQRLINQDSEANTPPSSSPSQSSGYSGGQGSGHIRTRNGCMGNMQGIIGIFLNDNTCVHICLLKGQRLFGYLKSFRIAHFNVADSKS